jgi:hypothetical protein
MVDAFRFVVLVTFLDAICIVDATLESLFRRYMRISLFYSVFIPRYFVVHLTFPTLD